MSDSILRGFGVSPSANRTAAETLAAQRLADHLPTGSEDPDKAVRGRAVLDAEDQVRSGKTPDLRQFNPKERRQILTEGRKPLLVSKAGRLGVGDLLDVYQAATAEERAGLVTDLRKKANSYVKKLSPEERANDTTYHRLVNAGLAPRQASERPTSPEGSGVAAQRKRAACDATGRGWIDAICEKLAMSSNTSRWTPAQV